MHRNRNERDQSHSIPSVNTMRTSQTATMQSGRGMGAMGRGSGMTTGRGTNERGKEAHSLTADKLNEFNNLQKKKDHQASRQNAFISRGGDSNGTMGLKK